MGLRKRTSKQTRLAETAAQRYLDRKKPLTQRHCCCRLALLTYLAMAKPQHTHSSLSAIHLSGDL